MTEHLSSPHGAPPSRRTALKALGGAVAAGGAAVAATGAAAPAAADGGKPGRIPKDLKPGGAFDRFVADLASKDQFSGSLLLTCRGRTVLSRSHGMADKRTGVRNGPETRFALASVTKLFTATAVHQLVQQGKLNYTDTVGAHLDGFPAEIADKVTVHHMLTHSSGLGDFFNLPGFPEESKKWDTADKVLNGTVQFIRRTKLAFPPGAGNLYSNAALCLLGAMIAAVSRRPYYDYVTEHVFQAAGMRDSAFYTKPQWRTDRRIAHPYTKLPGSSQRTDSLEENLFIGLPAGDSFATCADMERFAHALLDHDLLDAPHTDLMLGAKIPRPPQKNPPQGSAPPESTAFAGYGPVTALSQGQWIHGHGGGSSGASTNIDFFPGSGWVVVILSNYEARTTEPIAGLARRLILEQ
ncbi:serine hydrolase domain-containing protein [Actinomadura rubrisoli]|uniref:Class A beta-lactamase-related serine hydrolase n=1 Tax=Actinomadura rubrisoli TaxID=2530368 RepID=A0A4R5CAF0_9ACTN|nr:serine hydrolase domain-containing protein [Actinomadura rubrisoli]TDD95676.1 class A beta-lactamase-related serine hydrolase [Actinomadura rubrisoli]